MNNNIIKSLSLVLITAFINGCTATTVVTSPNTDTKTPTQNSSQATNPVTQNNSYSVSLSSNMNGVENPIGPENLQSIQIDGVTIPASEIKFGSGFSTKATSSDYEVTYEGAGKFSVVNKSTGKVLQNRALIIFNLLNSKTPLILPILQGIFENNIKMSIDLATGNIFGGVQKEDGTLDNTKPVFKIGTDGKLTISNPDGKQEVFSRNDANSTNLPDPEKTVTVTTEELKKQFDEVVSQTSQTSAIANYVGFWLYEGLGQRIYLQIKDAGQNKFDASATVAGKKYTGQGTYNPTGKNDTLTLKVPDDQMHIEMQLLGANALQLTLKSTSNNDVKTFVGVPVNLQRTLLAQ